MAFKGIGVAEDGATGWITIRRENRLEAVRMGVSNREIAAARSRPS